MLQYIRMHKWNKSPTPAGVSSPKVCLQRSTATMLKEAHTLLHGCSHQYLFRFVQADLTENNVLLYFLSVLGFELQILLTYRQVCFQPYYHLIYPDCTTHLQTFQWNRARRDEIRALLGWNLLTQMKLNPSLSPDEVGFHHEVISSHESGIYPVR